VRAAGQKINRAGALDVALRVSCEGTKICATKIGIENAVEEDMLSAIMQFTGVPISTSARRTSGLTPGLPGGHRRNG